MRPALSLQGLHVTNQHDQFVIQLRADAQKLQVCSGHFKLDCEAADGKLFVKWLTSTKIEALSVCSISEKL